MAKTRSEGGASGDHVVTFNKRTRVVGARNGRVGAYARAHSVRNADGTTTYTKKRGGTVTKPAKRRMPPPGQR